MILHPSPCASSVLVVGITPCAAAQNKQHAGGGCNLNIIEAKAIVLGLLAVSCSVVRLLATRPAGLSLPPQIHSRDHEEIKEGQGDIHFDVIFTRPPLRKSLS
jgi:hypothetical protein